MTSGLGNTGLVRRRIFVTIASRANVRRVSAITCSQIITVAASGQPEDAYLELVDFVIADDELFPGTFQDVVFLVGRGQTVVRLGLPGLERLAGEVVGVPDRVHFDRELRLLCNSRRLSCVTDGLSRRQNLIRKQTSGVGSKANVNRAFVTHNSNRAEWRLYAVKRLCWRGSLMIGQKAPAAARTIGREGKTCLCYWRWRNHGLRYLPTR